MFINAAYIVIKIRYNNYFIIILEENVNILLSNMTIMRKLSIYHEILAIICCIS